MKRFFLFQLHQMRIISNFLMRHYRISPWLIVSGSLISIVIGFSLMNEASEYLVEEFLTLSAIPFTHAVKRALDGLFFFLSFVVLVGVVEVLFRGYQMAEKEHLRLFPLSDSLLFWLKINDVALSLFVFFVPFTVIPMALASRRIGIPPWIAILFTVSLLCFVLQIIFFLFSSCILAVYLLPKRFWRNAIGISLAVITVFLLLLTVTRYFHSAGFAGFPFLSNPHFPTQLSTSIIMFWYSGDPRGSGMAFLEMIALTILSGLVCFVIYRAIFIHQADVLFEKVGPSRKPDSWSTRIVTAADQFIGQRFRKTWAICLKELASLLRDTSLKIAFFAGLLLSIFPFLPLVIATGRIADLALDVILIVIFLFSIHFLLFLSLSSLGREGETAQTLRLFPVSLDLFMVSKALIYIGSLAILLLAGTFFFDRYFGLQRLTTSLPALLIVVLLSVVHSIMLGGMTFSLGCIFPRFHSTNQFRAVSLWAVGLMFSLSSLYLSSTTIIIWALFRFGILAIMPMLTIAGIWIFTLSVLISLARIELESALNF